MLLPYKILIEFTMTVMGPPTLLFLFSFVALRIQEPDMQRDFKIPGGTGATDFAPPICRVTFGHFVSGRVLTLASLMFGRIWRSLRGYCDYPSGHHHVHAALLCVRGRWRGFDAGH